MDVLKGFRRRPLRSSLLLLQVFFGTLIMTLALSAAFGSRTPAAPLERFDLIAGFESESTSETYPLFYAQELPEILALATDIEQLAVVSDLYEPTVRRSRVLVFVIPAL